MDLLSVDDDDGHAHGFLVASDGLMASETDDVMAHDFQPLPLARTPRRRKIGKALQLVLLRKYVACAKSLRRLPERAMTEHLLDEAYDEFYFNGGSLSEPRLGYTAFLKLVRNRRGEVARLDRQATVERRSASKEQQEIDALIRELERVRQGDFTSDSLTEFDESGHAPSAGMDAPTDPHGFASVLMPQTPSTFVNGEEHVLVPKRKLELLLRFSQETLQSQKKLLEQVCTLERQLLELQHHHHPLGH